jgi:hypothetical protein
MGNPVIVDASFLVALWRKNDQNHPWAIQQAQLHPPPWITCESVLSEADHLLAPEGCATLRLACRRGALRIACICLANDALCSRATSPTSNPCPD